MRINLKTPQISLQNPDIYIFELISRCQLAISPADLYQLRNRPAEWLICLADSQLVSLAGLLGTLLDDRTEIYPNYMPFQLQIQYPGSYRAISNIFML
jgi:hypothetical protein